MTTAIAFEHVTKTFAVEYDRPRALKELFVGTLRRARRRREVITALADVTFTLEGGGTLGLVGANGTGKSTALKLAARILEPTSGRIFVNGRLVALLELGAGVHPDLSGLENIYLSGSLMGFSRREMEGRLRAIVEFSELGPFIDLPVRQYSSGMFMRLAFATAIHMDPEILLLDEILAVGDQAFRGKCYDRIMTLRKRGVTIVLVSHDLGPIRELCERALWLEGGQVRAYGPTDDVVEAYYASVIAQEEARLAAEAAGLQEESAAASPTSVSSEERDRWGSGEVEIVDVTILGPQGTAQHVLVSGQPMTVRIRYQAHRRIEEPVFGLAIHRQDGLHITGPNTLEAGVPIEAIEGSGEVRYVVESLPLLSGTYEVSASCYDQSCTHAYDHHHRRFPFRVRAGDSRPRFGLLMLPASWQHESDQACPPEPRAAAAASGAEDSG